MMRAERRVDQRARTVVSRDLGHGRTETTSVCLGW